MTLNSKIVYCRKKAGMSQEELGEVIGVSRQAISKWETGESTPEVGKLLLLAKTFGVTTDWLLSDDEPICEETEQEPKENTGDNPYYHRSMDSRGSYPEWIDNLPRSIGRLFRRFGWLLGVYIAVMGAVIGFIGGVVRIVSNLMVTGFHETTKVTVNAVNIPMDGFIAGEDIFFEQYESAANEMMADFAKINPVSVISTIMLVISVVMILGGIILAVTLKRYGREE